MLVIQLFLQLKVSHPFLAPRLFRLLLDTLSHAQLQAFLLLLQLLLPLPNLQLRLFKRRLVGLLTNDLFSFEKALSHFDLNRILALAKFALPLQHLDTLFLQRL